MIYFTANLQNFLNALESGVNLYPFYPTLELPHLQPLLWAFQVHLKLNFTTVLYVNFGLTYAANISVTKTRNNLQNQHKYLSVLILPSQTILYPEF